MNYNKIINHYFLNIYKGGDFYVLAVNTYTPSYVINNVCSN